MRVVYKVELIGLGGEVGVKGGFYYLGGDGVLFELRDIG